MPERALTKDEMLDDITLYWLIKFPGEIYRAPRSWAERTFHRLIHWNEVDKGGHFAAWEQPELCTTEVRAAFRSLR